MEELAETGLESDDSVGVIDGVGACSDSVSVLGGGTSTDGVNFDDFWGSSSFWEFEVYEVVTANVDDLLGCTAIGSCANFYQINEVSAKSSSIVVCDAKSNEKDPLVVCFGEMLIDFVATVGGVPVAEAHMLHDILKQNNVGNSGVVCFDSKARTAMAFLTLIADGEHGFMFFRNPSADMLLRESELNKDLLNKASFLLYGSLSLSQEMCRSTQLAAFLYLQQELKGKVGGVKANCIDTTDAGYAFVSELLEMDSFCANLSIYKDEKSSFFFANACGALRVTERGAISALYKGSHKSGLTES